MHAPLVWVLLGQGVGGNNQMTRLAAALGWPHQAKHLVFNRLSQCPNVLLGAAAVTLDRRRSSPLEPPWPDLVIAGSRRSAPVARWIKQRSGGRARLVHLMHAQAPLAGFDLIITTPQYRLPQRPNVLHNVGPLNAVDPARLAAAAAAGAERFAHLPRPYTALLVGGNSSSYVLDTATATRLGREASAYTGTAGGSLLVTTSARTPAAAAEALRAAITCPADVYLWRPADPANPYHAVLGLADRFIVTADSASLVVEACATGKPVALFEWPVRPDASRGVKGLLRRWGEARARSGPGPARPSARLYDRLVYLGLIKPARDFGALHRALLERGLVTRWGGEPGPIPARCPLDDLPRAVERIQALFVEQAVGASACDARRAPSRIAGRIHSAGTR